MLNAEQHKAVMMWGGRGARQVLRLRYPTLTVDDRTLDMAYTEEGVERVRAMGFNWAYLMCSWGFPPEVEKLDWESFRRAVRLYHQAGIQVCGGVVVSSCMVQGDYRLKTWYALDPWGKRIPVHTGRAAVCWHDPDWQSAIQDRLRVVIEAEADGVCFVEPWAGGIPWRVGRGLLGAAGCHDERCQAGYTAYTGGAQIPRGLSVRDPNVRRYLAWRGEYSDRQLQTWAEFARDLNPATVVVIQSGPLSDQNPFVEYGRSLGATPVGQGSVIVTGTLPQVERQRLVQNTATFAGARSGKATMIAASRAVPAGFDVEPVGTARRFAAAMGEACAMGVTPGIDATGLAHHRALTLLIHRQFEAQQRTIGQFNTWLDTHVDWLSARTSAGGLALYWPGEALAWQWDRIAPVWWGACHTLIWHGFPLRVVGDDVWDGVTTLIVPPGPAEGLEARLAQFTGGGGRVIALRDARPGMTGRPVWANYPRRGTTWLHWPGVRRVSGRAVVTARRWYHTRLLARVVVNRFRRGRGAAPNTLFNLPPASVQAELVSAIGNDMLPRALGEGPVLFTIWDEPGGGQQWHLVNYLDSPQRVTLHAPQFVDGWIVAPFEDDTTRIFGTSLIVTVDTYKVLRFGTETERRPKKTAAKKSRKKPSG